ncbi:expressed unknown protein [Seminavis robusta]|uniref:Uncharacterized protein n=1 Tax=Seminavis robusta TaxID=568900 RepID=A0A9N8DVV9_9STRA|nr:expressed unknown protein [Seminavis robusta]|eukprot:Sro391_g133050.1 n/a (391) ;mRNA; f:14898-16145
MTNDAQADPKINNPDTASRGNDDGKTGAPNEISDEAPTFVIDTPNGTYVSRFSWWCALTIFSAVTLIALTTETDTKQWQAEEKWILSVSVLSLLVSGVACVAHVNHPAFVGMPLEGLLLLTELGLWVGGLIVMMDTQNMLALDGAGRIVNANLYFFGWANLTGTVALLVGYANHSDLTATNPTNGVGYWAGLCIASLVAMSSSIQTLVNGVTLDGEDFDCDRGPSYCNRLKFSITLGAVSTLAGGLGCLISFQFNLSAAAKASASLAMFLAWAVGVSLTTFGEQSPGNRVGNLYFSCWGAFVFSVFMLSSSIKECCMAAKQTVEGGMPAEPKTNAREWREVKSQEDGDGANTASPTEALTPTSNSDPKENVALDDSVDEPKPVKASEAEV